MNVSGPASPPVPQAGAATNKPCAKADASAALPAVSADKTAKGSHSLRTSSDTNVRNRLISQLSTSVAAPYRSQHASMFVRTLSDDDLHQNQEKLQALVAQNKDPAHRAPVSSSSAAPVPSTATRPSVPQQPTTDSGQIARQHQAKSTVSSRNAQDQPAAPLSTSIAVPRGNRHASMFVRTLSDDDLHQNQEKLQALIAQNKDPAHRAPVSSSVAEPAPETGVAHMQADRPEKPSR